MARQRKGRAIDGILVLDKPRGITSNGALQRVKRALFAAKAGHTGSLDPMATGVLPLCFGEATKFSQYLLDSDKFYRATVTFGVATETGDAEGEVIGETDASAITEAALADVIEQFTGEIEQVPSMYSAVKHQGQPLYKLARAGITVERQARAVTIYRLGLLAFRPGVRAEADLEIHCSKGTYVRSLAEDIGERLGCGAHVSALRRVRSGPYSETDCVSLEQVEALAEAREFDALNALVRPVETALADFPAVELPENSSYYLRQGQPVLAPNLPTEGMVKVVLDSGEFLGVGEILDDGRLAPRRLVTAQRGSQRIASAGRSHGS